MTKKKMRLKIKGSYNLKRLLNSEKRFQLLVGGSRSGKTHATLQYIIIYCYNNTNKIVTIARKTFPALRAGAYREFIDLLKEMEIYDEKSHNKTNNTYSLNDNLIQFISVDQSTKLRGLKHDLVFVDEVSELEKEEFEQLAMRTNYKIIMAQNPSNALHFSLLYQNNPDCQYTHSTYLNNPFLSKSIVNQIESYRETDEDLWNVYGLGLPSKNNELVYSNVLFFNEEDLWNNNTETLTRQPLWEEEVWGLDFGFQHPTALVRCRIKDMNLYAEEIIHESFLTTTDLIKKMIEFDVPRNVTIYCDSAEPKTIEEIKRAGFDVKQSNKEVIEGIKAIKSTRFHIKNSSTKLIEETRRYKWKMKGEIRTDEPIKLFDDGMCAIRYAYYTHTYKRDKYLNNDFDIDFVDY